MPTVAPIQNDFSGGEFSPLVHGRSDIDRYKTGARKIENFFPTVQGGLVRRSGSRFVAEVKDSTKKTRVLKFQFSTTQAYIIELGDFYFRIYKDHGQVESAPNVPVEGFMPYMEADLYGVKYAQSNDTIYFSHPKYPVVKLLRYSDTRWESQFVNFADGPYMDVGQLAYAHSVSAQRFWDGKKFSLSGVSGDDATLTLTLPTTLSVTGAVANGNGEIRITVNKDSAFESGDEIYVSGVLGTTEANNTWPVVAVGLNQYDLVGSTFVNAYGGSGSVRPLAFKNQDIGIGAVGRLFRLQTAGNWYWVQINGITNPLQATVKIKSTIPGIAGGILFDNFRYGLWAGSPTFGSTSGYPSAVTFHEDRLCFGGTPIAPQRVDLSKSGDYERFSPTEVSGTITSENAISATINSNDINAIRWMNTDEKGLLIGTDSSEWVIKPATASEVLSPTNIAAKKASSYGSADVMSINAGKAVLYLQKSSRRLRELIYFYDMDGFRANDLSVLSEHLLASGIKEMAYQKDPHSILWAVRNDGAIATMTYERDLDSVKAAWVKQVLGGYSDAGHTTRAEVESVAVISSPDGLTEEVWMVVKRCINGTVKRYVEYITKFLEEEDAQEDAIYLDCSLSYDGAPATVISGLDHLEGETVQIVADGCVHPNKVVTGGSVTLNSAASVVHIGYHYNSDLQLMRFDAGSANGTAIGKQRKTHVVGFMLHRTLGMQIGMDFDNLLDIVFRSPEDNTNQAVPLFTGIKSEEIEANYDMDNFITVRQPQPLPMTILAIMPQMKTQDNQ